MDTLSTETIMAIIAYLLPGFIINTMYSYAYPIGKNDSFDIILRYIFFTIINYLVIYLIDLMTHLFFQDRFLIKNFYIIFIIRTFLSPIIIGIILIYLSRFQPIRKLLRLIGLSSITSIPTAWDYIFHKVSNEGGSYVTITLKDYEEVYGFFNENSFASSLRPSFNNDVYIDKIFSDNSFEKELESGLLISQNDILAISFYKPLEQRQIQKEGKSLEQK